jgi:hypothetical protein
MTVKPLPSRVTEAKQEKHPGPVEYGFRFAFGFWLATLIIFVPIGFCLVVLGLA